MSPQISRAVARGDVHTAAQRDGQMCEVAAHPLPLLVGVPCGLGRPRVFVAEGDAIMHEVADRPHTRRAALHVAEQRPGGVRQPVGFAIPAAEQIDQTPREAAIRPAPARSSGACSSGAPLSSRHERAADPQPPRGRQDAMADIAEHVAVEAGLEWRIELDTVRRQQVLARDGCTFRISSIGVGAGQS